MILIHTSDVHLDSPLTSRLTSDKVRERRRELLSSFGRLVEEAKAIHATGVIIAGDLFDSERISRKALDTALNIIEEAEEISFLYLIYVSVYMIFTNAGHHKSNLREIMAVISFVTSHAAPLPGK